MEDFQEQEYEFLRRLEEEKFDRRKLLKRGLVAGAGLTILSMPAGALAARQKALANPPLRGGAISLKEWVAQAKKEGTLNTIALPPDWSNYGEVMSTFTKKYGIKISNDNPDGSSAQENQAVRSLKGDPRAPDVLDVSPSFAAAGANEGLYAKFFTKNFNKVPRAMKDGRGILGRRLLGRDLVRRQHRGRAERPEDVAGPAQARVQEQGRPQRQPAHVRARRRRACSRPRSRTAARCRTSAPGSTSSRS